MQKGMREDLFQHTPNSKTDFRYLIFTLTLNPLPSREREIKRLPQKIVR
jgi:hypothetical protein